MGALSPPPAAPDLTAAARTRRPLACREHYPQESRQHYRRAPARAAVRAPSLQGTVLHTKGGSALFSSLTLKSPFPRRGSRQERATGRARREEDEDGERPTARHAARSTAIFALPYARLVAGPQPAVEDLRFCALNPFCRSSIGVPAPASPARAPGSHCLLSHSPDSLREQSPSRKRVLHVLLHAKHPLRCLTASPEPSRWVSTKGSPAPHTHGGEKPQSRIKPAIRRPANSTFPAATLKTPYSGKTRCRDPTENSKQVKKGAGAKTRHWEKKPRLDLNNCIILGFNLYMFTFV
ncbi:uncharacterized protein ACIB01_002428 [Guaruba guarouba]